ncbi:serine hydrolase domain-containing protein [Candidatus Palauibacter sp.]|uniref:serine hydrolase domain-containing protein n=1 Tax=Candidatus Palauibacter sp. TaxID=3101350 RepID=UPI003B5A301B
MKVSRRVRGIPAARWLFLAIILPSTILAGATWSVPALAAQEARTLSYGEPEEVGMSRAVLEGALGLYHEAVERGDIVGAVLLVARKGKIVLHEAVGMRDKERGLPMERNSMFRMASNTKPVVATAIAQLVEEGKLSYDDLVREYIPEWDNYRAGFITVGHLLSHSSGLRIPTLFLQPLGENPTLQSESARFGAIGAEVTPGETYSYNNPGYNTLGALVEIASGQLLENRLMETVYGPLGMADSYNHHAAHEVGGKVDRMGSVYYQRGPDGDWTPGGTPGGPVAFPFARASGGMISSAWDYAVFSQMFLNSGTYDGAEILTPESVELMTSPKIHIGGEGDEASHYGYGWRLADGTYGHGGSDGTNAWLDPDREIIGLVFTQTPRGDNRGTRLERFRELVNLSLEGGGS